MIYKKSKLQIDPKRSRLRMVREQLARRGIVDELVLNAMATVPRHLFVPNGLFSHAYDDRSLPIGYGQTISQPFTVAKMLQNLELKPGLRVLEIGMGSGYQAAVIAAMGCTVFTMERLPELYQITKKRMAGMNYHNLHMHLGDGTRGFPQAAPYDRIIVAAGGPGIPKPLVEQLENHGILIIPVGPRPRTQVLYKLIREDNKIYSENLGKADFVNLVGDHGW